MRARRGYIVGTIVCGVVLAGGTAGAQQPTTTTAVTAFVDVAVVPMDRERVLPHQTVVIRDGRIAALGPTGDIPVPADAERIDGQGRYLLPGLADMHARLPLSLDWGMGPPQDSATAATRLQRARRILVRYLAAGVTTVRLMQGLPDELLALRAEAAQGAILSPRLAIAATPFVFARRLGLTPAAALQLVKVAQKAGFDLLNVYDVDGAYGTVDAAVFDSVIAAAHRVGIPVAGPYRPGYVYQSARSFVSAEHLVDVMPDDSAQIVSLKLNWPTPDSGGAWGTPTLVYVTQRMAWLDRATAADMLAALRHAGVGLLLGSAGWDANPAAIIPRELEALVAAGLTPYDALVTGTRNVAAYFGALDSAGTVAVGKRADLVLLPGNPLADIRQVAEPAGVMIGGRWLPRATLVQLTRLIEGFDTGLVDTP